MAKPLTEAQKLKQRKFLESAQERLGAGPAEMARHLHTNLNTYKAWLYGKNRMPEIARIAIKCILSNPSFQRALKFRKALNDATRDPPPEPSDSG